MVANKLLPISLLFRDSSSEYRVCIISCWTIFYFYLFIFLIFIYVFIFWLLRVLVAAHGIFHCGVWALHCSAWTSLQLWRTGLLVAVRGLSSCCMWAQQLRCVGLVALWHVGPQFPDQGQNPRPLHCKVDSLPLDHQGSPNHPILLILLICDYKMWQV